MSAINIYTHTHICTSNCLEKCFYLWTNHLINSSSAIVPSLFSSKCSIASIINTINFFFRNFSGSSKFWRSLFLIHNRVCFRYICEISCSAWARHERIFCCRNIVWFYHWYWRDDVWATFYFRCIHLHLYFVRSLKM